MAVIDSPSKLFRPLRLAGLLLSIIALFACDKGAPREGLIGSSPNSPQPRVSKPSTTVRVEAADYVRFLELDETREGATVGPCAEGEVDLYASGSSCSVGWAASGEWLEYDLPNIASANYDIELRITSAQPDKQVMVSINGANVGNVYSNGAGWDAWKTETIEAVALEGDITLRITFPDGWVNLNYIELVASSYAPPPSHSATFSWFEYAGKDRVFDTDLPATEYQNPILAGFYPDPSITRAGEDFYMVHSSFAYWPGLPIFHSTDLVNWRPLGHALTRKDQVDLVNRQVSEGIFAPTIRYHDGTFYIITTATWAGGNFIITADDPAGPWSDPIWLPEVGGIDPDLFFDQDGRVYIAHNDAPEGTPLYEGHRAIWLWEYDPETKGVIKDSGRVIVNGGVDLATKPIWIEAPHIFQKDGWYYLSCAEGGTGPQHSQVIFRSKSLNEPFVPANHNPILTQRDLAPDRANPITAAGHADMIETPSGEWWAVFLAIRTYGKALLSNIGRETYLLPVRWENGWPIILDPGQAIPYRHPNPKALKPTVDAAQLTGNFVWHDGFETASLRPAWNTLRAPGNSWYSINTEESKIVLQPLAASLAGRAQPAFIGRRQQHAVFDASTELELGLADGMSAGLAAFQNETYHYYMGVKRSAEGHTIFIERTQGSEPEVIHSAEIEPLDGKIILGIQGNAERVSFYYAVNNQQQLYLAKDLDARMLSTSVAGGFVGTYLGIHARQEE